MYTSCWTKSSSSSLPSCNASCECLADRLNNEEAEASNDFILQIRDNAAISRCVASRTAVVHDQHGEHLLGGWLQVTVTVSKKSFNIAI